MTELRERVARAIGAVQRIAPWDSLAGWQQRQYREMADVAREPYEAVLQRWEAGGDVTRMWLAREFREAIAEAAGVAEEPKAAVDVNPQVGVEEQREDAQ